MTHSTTPTLSARLDKFTGSAAEQRVRAFIAGLLQISPETIQFHAMLSSLSSPPGYEMKFNHSVIASVPQGFTWGGTTARAVVCHASHPSSLSVLSAHKFDELMARAVEQVASAADTPGISLLGGWMSREHMEANELPINNIHTRYDFLMQEDGTSEPFLFGRLLPGARLIKSPNTYVIDYLAGDVVPAFWPVHSAINPKHISHIRVPT